MAHDWVKNYIDGYKERHQQKQNDQKTADLAQAGAPDAFERVQERVRQDLAEFHTARVFTQVFFGQKAFTAGQFEVYVDGPPPLAQLTVELNIVLIKYTWDFPAKGGKPAERKNGALRIGADLNGETKIYKNGEAFGEASDVSEFLLEPLLKYAEA